MSKMTSLLLLSLLPLLPLSCASTPPGPVKLKEADNGKSVELKVGGQLEISLAGNITTGYSWGAVGFDAKTLELTAEPEYLPDRDAFRRSGVGGTFVFHFKAVAPGKTTVALGYRRPWEKTAPAKTFSLEVEVR